MKINSLNWGKLEKEFPFLKDVELRFYNSHLQIGDVVEIKRADKNLLNTFFHDDAETYDYVSCVLIYDDGGAPTFVGEETVISAIYTTGRCPSYMVVYEYYHVNNRRSSSAVIYKANPSFVEGELKKALERAEREIDAEVNAASD